MSTLLCRHCSHVNCIGSCDFGLQWCQVSYPNKENRLRTCAYVADAIPKPLDCCCSGLDYVIVRLGRNVSDKTHSMRSWPGARLTLSMRPKIDFRWDRYFVALSYVNQRIIVLGTMIAQCTADASSTRISIIDNSAQSNGPYPQGA